MPMGTILDEIVANKRREIEALQALVPMAVVAEAAMAAGYEPVSLREALVASPTGIIAECKRCSPSKGEIHPKADVRTVVGGYAENGAAACSVLTDTVYFGGSLADLAVARSAVSIPLLRKDFVVSEYQLYQARACGADAVLLIAAVLSADEVRRFTAVAHKLGLEVLLELHDCSELDHYIPEVDVVGVNNRNLATFVTDLDTARHMAALLPAEAVKVAESGLRTMSDVESLRSAGYSGFLIGETFMKAPVPGDALKEFIDGINQ